MQEALENLSKLSVPQILQQYPSTQTVFDRFGLSAYRATEFENLEATVRVHQLDLSVVLMALRQEILK